MVKKKFLYVCIHFPHTFFELKKIEGGEQYVYDEICKHLSKYNNQYKICLGVSSQLRNYFFYGNIQKSLGLIEDFNNKHLVVVDSNLVFNWNKDGSPHQLVNLLIIVDEKGKRAQHFISKAKELGIETIIVPCKKIENKINFKSFVLSDNGNKEEVQLIDKYSFCIHYEYDDYWRPVPERMESWSTLVCPDDKGIGLFLADGKYRLHTLHKNGHWYYTEDNEELLKHISVSSETELYNIIKNDILYYVSNPTTPIRDKEY